MKMGNTTEEPYEPEVDDYVVWDRTTWVGNISDEGWAYFKGDPVEPKKGFPTPSRYITIETGVRRKPEDQIDKNSRLKHEMVHTLLLCYESQWKDLKFVKRRKDKNIQHWSQYDDITGENE